jgi:AraC-like DNA-binding protein
VKRHGLRRTEMRHWGISTDDARIARTIAYLDRHLSENVRLTATARAVGLSPPHLADIFKTATGETIGAFLRRRRMEHARKLLTETGLSVAEVATQVGYASAPHFAVTFKKAWGVTPAAHRNVRRS